MLGEDGAVSVSEHEVDDALKVHVYKLHVYTGDKRRAGTDANVFVNVIGENGDSGERPLTTSETNRDKFERGKVSKTLRLASFLSIIFFTLLGFDLRFFMVQSK